MTPVVQTVSSWSGWPDDVRERLRRWNREFLLSFRRGGDFICDGCCREIQAHPNGNAVVRPWRKAHGVLRCEDCMIALARAYETPPSALAHRARDLSERLRDRIETMEKRLGRLRQQLAIDQIYIEALEDLIPRAALEVLRDELRGRYRNSAHGRSVGLPYVAVKRLRDDQARELLRHAFAYPRFLSIGGIKNTVEVRVSREKYEEIRALVYPTAAISEGTDGS